jgi:hypothetical protein
MSSRWKTSSCVLAVAAIACLAAGCATSPPDDPVDRPVTAEEAAAVEAALRQAEPGNSIVLHFISGETVSGGFVEWNDGAITLAHPGGYVSERKTYELAYVRRVDVIVMRPETPESP